ncbi:MAG: HAD-IA family hydrolase [Candidatus Woesearchaeota archaeon]
MKPLILFDFDGTLVDSTQEVLFVVNTLLKKRGLSEVTAQEVATTPLEALARSRGVGRFRVLLFLREVQQLLIKRSTPVPVHEHIKQLLNSVSAYVDVGIVTSNSLEYVHAVVSEEFLSRFVCVLHAGLFTKNKVISRVRKQRGLSKKYVLYVGDESRDVHAARRAGVDCLAVSWGLQGVDSLLASRPAMLAQSTEEAIHLLKAWIASRG